MKDIKKKILKSTFKEIIEHNILYYTAPEAMYECHDSIIYCYIGVNSVGRGKTWCMADIITVVCVDREELLEVIKEHYIKRFIEKREEINENISV